MLCEDGDDFPESMRVKGAFRSIYLGLIIAGTSRENRLMCTEDSSAYEMEQRATLAAILAIGQADIQAGRCRAVEVFFAELDAEDESRASADWCRN